VLRRPPSLTYWLGLALAMTGSLVIVRGDLLRHVKLGSGDAMALAASACFGVYLLATERVRKTASTIGFLRLAILSSTMFLLVMNLAMGTPLAVPSGRSWGARADVGGADSGRSAGAGGRGAGQPKDSPVRRGECHSVRSRRARISSKQNKIRNKFRERTFILYGVTRRSAICAGLCDGVRWNLEEEGS
jgi:hypothetical protein